MAVDVELLLPVTIALTVVVSTGVGVVVKAWPIITKLNNLVNGWFGQHGEPSMMERIKKIEADSASASFHSKPNHGSSAYDQLKKSVDDLTVGMAESHMTHARLWDELNKMKEEKSE